MHNALLLQRYGLMGRTCKLAKSHGPRSPISHLLFRATQGILARERLVAANGNAVACALSVFSQIDRADLDRESCSFWSDDIIGCIDAISSILHAVVTGQNCLTRALAAELSIGEVDKSFRRVVEGLATSKRSRWPEAIADRLETYWKASGKLVRDLRDSDQHSSPDMTDCRLTITIAPRLSLTYKHTKVGEINVIEAVPVALDEFFAVCEDCFALISNVSAEYSTAAPTIDLELERALGNGAAQVFFLDKNPDRWMAFLMRPDSQLQVLSHGIPIGPQA